MHKDIQLLLMTHGDLGKELIQTASMFLTGTETILFMGLHEDDSISDYQKQIETIAGTHENLLILTDMVTAATTRIAAQALAFDSVEVISGVNLLMLITAQREKETHTLEQLCDLISLAAKEDIVNIRKRLIEEGLDRKERGTCTKY